MNLVKKAVNNGGKLYPLIIPGRWSAMNPSVFNDNGEILVNVRVANYAYYHSENQQRFPSRWGPLSYLHPENDQRLVTDNYLVRLNSEFAITDCKKVEMLKLHTPQWEFVGLEDARLVKWDGDYYLIGCRRDLDTIGTSRMEYSKIDINMAKEISRQRIPAPAPDNSYCEKNWMPILDKPYHFIKWTSPTELIKATDTTKSVFTRESVKFPKDQRGSTQLIRWGSMYICLTHEVDLFKNYLQQKDAIYRHRFMVWDEQFNIVGATEPFSFTDSRVEFSVGMAEYEGDLLISFSIQDNAAFILRVPKLIVEDLIVEALND
jgi:hypothetical protein